MTMRLAPLSILFVLALPAPALAADANVNIGDDFFGDPSQDISTVQIQPGESVTWHWTGTDQHTVTARPGQTERFGSSFKSSGTFQHTFKKPGRFTYFCQVHSNMKGAVEVGPAPFPDTLLPKATSVKAKATGSTAKVSFKLSEKSRVKVSVSGRSDRVTSRLLGKGKRSLKFRHLKAGTYTVTLSLRDVAKNKGKSVKKSFKVS
jgi:plastocyanin